MNVTSSHLYEDTYFNVPLCFFFFWTPFLFVSFAISRWMLKKTYLCIQAICSDCSMWHWTMIKMFHESGWACWRILVAVGWSDGKGADSLGQYPVSSVTWHFTYLFIWSKGTSAIMPNRYPRRTVPLRISSDQAAHMAPLEARTLWPFLKVSVPSSLQKCMWTFVCCVSFPVLLVLGEFGLFL